MQDSLTLQLISSAAAMQDAISQHLIKALQAQGFTSINAGLLLFLSALDCGENQASAVARKLGVTRQMVAKNVKELVQLGWLEQRPGQGRQKIIVFTQAGENLISLCRNELVKLDGRLIDWVGKNALNQSLKTMQKLPQELSTDQVD